MKTIISRIVLILFLFCVNITFAQSPTLMKDGIRVTNLAEKTIDDNVRVAVFDENNVLRFFVNKDEFGGNLTHNELPGIQGGNPTERYHLTQTQYNWIAAQMYVNSVGNLSISSPTGNQEFGVTLPITLSYNLISNDDTITAATINPGSNNVLANVDTGAKTIAMGNYSTTQVFSLVRNYTRLGVPSSATTTTNYTPFYPKYTGISTTVEDITSTDYSNLSVGNGFTKLVNNATTLSVTVNNSTPQYVWFVSTVNTTNIKEGLLSVTVNNWGVGTSGFWRKAVTGFVLNNGTDTVTMYVYRSALPINTGGNTIIYNFNN